MDCAWRIQWFWSISHCHFFVFHSPCPDLSSAGKTLAEYGWNTPWRKPYCLSRKLKRASSNYNLLFSAKNYEALELALNTANLNSLFPSDFQTERIAFVDNKKNQFLSVFYHIRNSFAHCRLNMVDVDGECIFILEDGVPKKGRNQLKLSARMIIKNKLFWNGLILSKKVNMKIKGKDSILWISKAIYLD